jgi:lysophospholipase L1-like esterase
LALALGALLVALLLAEVVVRIVMDEPPGHHHRLFCEFDPELGWRKVRNGSGRHVTAEYDVTERFDAEGLRGPGFSVPKPPGRKRILLLGDSFVEGYTVAFEDTVGEVIARETGVEVVNGGTGGYSTDQELLFFERDGRRYEPDVTILFFYVNDVWFNAQDRYWRGAKPRFRVADDGGLELVRRTLPPPKFRRTAGAWFEKHSYLIRLVRTVARNLEDHEATAPPFRVYRKNRAPEIDAAWRLTERLLEEVARRVRATGSAFVLVLVPPIFRVHDDAPRPEGDDFGRIERDLHAVCARLDVPFLDPRPALRASGERVYFPVDRHWNETGHRIVGRFVAERVRPLLE